MQFGEPHQTFFFLGISLFIGLLVGLERGWKERMAKEGERVAGVRTYALIGLLGGAIGLITKSLGGIVLGLSLLAVAAMLTAGYVGSRSREDVGITSLVASFLTFLFGVMAGMGEVAAASAFAVVTTLLLDLKSQLHQWIGALEAKELRAVLQLLLISVVLLPILPNHGFGPWQALNPHEIWWLVVLIACISFAGYFAIKLAGASKGVLYTGLFAGLASSTAATLAFARSSRVNPEFVRVFSTGIMLACGTMFPRIFLICALLNLEMAKFLFSPLLTMMLLTYGTALFYWRSIDTSSASTLSTPLDNPLELRSALAFAALLALITFSVKALQSWLGNTGVLMLAALSGIADVDAITLSLARMGGGDLQPNIAVIGVISAAAVNSVIKAVLATAFGGPTLGIRVALPLVLVSALGVATAYYEFELQPFTSIELW